MTQDWKDDLRRASGQPGSTPGSDRKVAAPGPPAKGPTTGGGQGQDFWQQYFQDLHNGYFDQSGYLRPDFMVYYPQQIADRLEKDGMTRSLLRSFYSEVATIRHLVRQRPSDFDRYRPRIMKLPAHASNATNRRTGKAPPRFHDFISNNADLASRDKKDFLDGFCEHFECVVLYFKGR